MYLFKSPNPIQRLKLRECYAGCVDGRRARRHSSDPARAEFYRRSRSERFKRFMAG